MFNLFLKKKLNFLIIKRSDIHGTIRILRSQHLHLLRKANPIPPFALFLRRTLRKPRLLIAQQLAVQFDPQKAQFAHQTCVEHDRVHHMFRPFNIHFHEDDTVWRDFVLQKGDQIKRSDRKIGKFLPNRRLFIQGTRNIVEHFAFDGIKCHHLVVDEQWRRENGGA